VEVWMKEPYGEGLASHTGSESCAHSRKAGREALTGAHAGWVLSRGTSRKRKEADVFSGRINPPR